MYRGGWVYSATETVVGSMVAEPHQLQEEGEEEEEEEEGGGGSSSRRFISIRLTFVLEIVQKYVISFFYFIFIELIHVK